MADDSRAKVFEEIARNFIASWNSGINADKAAFLAQFSPTVQWHDHAFFIRHSGQQSMWPFRTLWLTSIENFRCDIRSIKPVKNGVAIQCVYNGTMVGALPGREASGRSFAVNVLVLLGINEKDLIQHVDEYYSATLDEAGDIDTYRLVQPPKPRAGKL